MGKSSLRKRLALDLPDNVIFVDIGYNGEITSDSDKVFTVKSVHNLEETSQIFERIL